MFEQYHDIWKELYISHEFKFVCDFWNLKNWCPLPPN